MADAKQAYDYTHEAIARAVLYKRAFLINLLQESGVAVSNSISDADLTTAILTALAKSPRFQQDLLPALQEVMIAKHAGDGAIITKNGNNNSAVTLDHFSLNKTLGATGERRLKAFGDEYTTDINSIIDTPAQGGSSTDTSSTDSSSDSGGGTSLLGSVFDAGFIKSILTTGIGVVANKVNSSTQTGLAGSALAIEQEKTKQAALQAQLAAKAKAGGTTAGKPVMSTGVKIALAVGGVALVGTVIYLVARKPKS